MIVANVADLHFRGRDLDAKRRQWEACLRVCAERGVELICCAGDILDKSTIGDRNAPDGAVIDAFTHPLTEWIAKSDGTRRFVTVVGNHDKAGAYSQDSLTFLDGRQGITVFREPCAKLILPSAGPPLYLVPLPWCWAGGNPTAIVRRLRAEWQTNVGMTEADQRISLLLPHIQFHGAFMSQTEACEKTGEECAPGEWHMDLEKVRPLFTHVAGGDFHRHQPGYVGALTQNGAHEEGNPAGFEIWDTATNAVEWVELHEAPTYHTMPVESRDEIDMVLNSPAKPNTIIRYRCAADLIPSQEQLLRAEAIGADLLYDPPRLERVSRVDPEEAPPEIVNQPHRLIDLWASKQEPVLDAEAIAAMHEEYDLSIAGATT